MKLMKRKTRKTIKKNVRKAINKHGSAIAVGLIGGIATTLATLANNDEPGPTGTSKMADLSRKARALFTKDDSKDGRIAGKAGVGRSFGSEADEGRNTKAKS